MHMCLQADVTPSDIAGTVINMLQMPAPIALCILCTQYPASATCAMCMLAMAQTASSAGQDRTFVFAAVRKLHDPLAMLQASLVATFIHIAVGPGVLAAAAAHASNKCASVAVTRLLLFVFAWWRRRVRHDALH